MNRKFSLKIDPNYKTMSSNSIEPISSQNTIQNRLRPPKKHQTEIQRTSLPSSISLEEERIAVQELGKMALEQSDTTLESQRVLKEQPSKEEEMVDESKEEIETHSQTRKLLKAKTQHNNHKKGLGEEILNQASFRQSLKDLIMGDFQ